MCFALGSASPHSVRFNTNQKMRVLKRGGAFEEVNFEKIAERIKKLGWNLPDIDASVIVAQVASSIVDGIATESIDQLTAEIAISKNADHPDYGKLAARIVMSNIHKKTSESVIETYEKMASALHPSFLAMARLHEEELQDMIEYKRDYDFDFFGMKTLERMYCTKIDEELIERPQHVYLRVALALCGRDGDMLRVKETYDLLSKKFFTHASPTLFNAGMKVQQLSSCYLDSSHDSLDGIFDCFHRSARISKFGGGLGVNVSAVRSKGAPIHSTNGTSDGIIPMLKVANNVACYINQGGKRKGSMAVYLEPHHPDVFDFLNLKRPGGDEEMRCRDLFLAMWVSDEFMRRVEAGEKWSLMDPLACPGLDDVYGDAFTTLYKKYEAEGKASKVVDARDVWNAILTSQIESGVPYILNKDACNVKSNQRNVGTIKCSNLCVAPETLVLTRQGHKRIDELCDVSVDVWNGVEWSNVVVKKTNERAELLRVTCSDGKHLECTPYHKFYVQVNYTGKVVEKRASELTPGDWLIKWDAPVMTFEDAPRFANAYTHGFFCGDGTYHVSYTGLQKYPMVALYGEKKLLLHHIDVRSTSGREDANGRINVQLPLDLPDKFEVPMTAPLQDRLDWLAGLVDADGHKQSHIDQPNTYSVYIASTNYDFLKKVQAMLLTMGAQSRLTMMREEGCHALPNGHGGMSEYFCKRTYRLGISSVGVGRLLDVGFRPRRVTLDSFEVARKSCERYIQVEKVEYTGRMDATYCFNEPKRHMGIFNGIITGNCAEIIEYSSPGEEVAVCTLASIGLPAFIKHGVFDFDELHRVTKVVARNLDTVIDMNHYPVEEARTSNMRHRPIGIGIQGLADTFIKLRMPFDSKDALELNERIMATMYHAALEMSTELSSTHGPYATFDGSPASHGLLQYDLWKKEPVKGLDWDGLKKRIANYGLRNSLSIALMPTASTAQLLGNSEAAEPVTSFYYVRRTLAGEYACIHKYLLKDLVSRGLWNPTIKNALIRDGGSIQNIYEIPKELRDLYKTSYDVKQRVIIDQAAARGPYVCQSMSMNLFVAAPTFAKLTAMHFHSWKSGLKTINYYLRSKPASRAAQVTVESTSTSNSSSDTDESCIMCSG